MKYLLGLLPLLLAASASGQESKGTGNAILRSAVVRPGGTVQEGFEVVGAIQTVGD